MKNIVLTGAGKGIGFELAKRMSQDNRVIAISRNVDSLVSSERLIPISFDLTQDLEPLLEEISCKFNSIDVVINNAGALINQPFEEIAKTDLHYIYSVNVFAPFMLTSGLMHLLKRGVKPHVVNISSMGGVNGTAKFPGLSAYSSSKGALSILSECLAEEYKDDVSFNCLALGAVQTEMLSDAFPDFTAPLSAKEMAEYIADFALSGHKYINGKTISVSSTTP